MSELDRMYISPEERHENDLVRFIAHERLDEEKPAIYALLRLRKGLPPVSNVRDAADVREAMERDRVHALIVAEASAPVMREPERIREHFEGLSNHSEPYTIAPYLEEAA